MGDALRVALVGGPMYDHLPGWQAINGALRRARAPEDVPALVQAAAELALRA